MYNIINFKKSIFYFFILLTLPFSVSAQLKLQNLKIENLTNPMGMGVKNPRFSWELVSDKKNVKQTAYEIQVTDGKNMVWNSGKITDESSIFNIYKGKDLRSNTKYIWQVHAWDNQNNTSDWAKATFHTALMNPLDWKAKWITSGLKSDTVNGIVPMFKKTFVVKKKITSATVFATSRGLYSAKINSEFITEAYLTPGWTSYNKHLQYQTIDVTTLIAQKENTINIKLGSGWYRTQLGWFNNTNIYGKETALLFQLEIKYTDGTQETILSDNTWQVAESDIVFSEIYNGEIQDARRGRDVAVQRLQSQAVIANYPTDYIIAAENEPIKKH